MTSEPEVFLISLFGSVDEQEQTLLHRCALQTWPSALGSGLASTLDEAALILFNDAELRNKATRCEIHLASDEEMIELELVRTASP